MELKSLLAESKEITIPFPDMEGFELTVCYISKEQIRKITEKARTIGFDSKTHTPTESVDDELFTKLYVSKALTNWKGLKFEYLKKLVLIDEESMPEEGELEYSENSAIQLVNNSRMFDSWISSVISDIALFNKGS